MKKKLLTILISLMIPNMAMAYGDIYTDPAVEQTPEQKELESLQHFFFETPINYVDVNKKPTFQDFNPGLAEFGNETINGRGMPLFKQVRIRVQNYYRTKAHEEMLEQKRLEEEFLKKLEEENYTSEDVLEEMQAENLQNFLDQMDKEKKINNKQKKKKLSIFKKNSPQKEKA